MEESKAKGICHEGPARGGRDMISKLHDSLISQILMYLPTKEAVRTSVLSNRWKSVWLLITQLGLDSSDFPDYNAFVSFMDRFLDFYREEKSCLDKLVLRIQKLKNDPSCVTRWIDFVATRKLKHLDVEYHYVSRKQFEVIPGSLSICETLLYLRLTRVFLGSFESVSLPHLKTMCLEENLYPNDTCLELLISSCPVLEDLSIIRRLDDNVRVLRLHSQTITSLKDVTHSMVKTEKITVSSVPQCLLSSLEFVEIKSRYQAEFVAMELARYFAANSVILKKLVLRWSGSVLGEESVLRDLIALLRRPSMCQIEVYGPVKQLDFRPITLFLDIERCPISKLQEGEGYGYYNVDYLVPSIIDVLRSHHFHGFLHVVIVVGDASCPRCIPSAFKQVVEKLKRDSQNRKDFKVKFVDKKTGRKQVADAEIKKRFVTWRPTTKRIAFVSDNLDNLPDSLFCRILSFLPIEVVVTTSIISKRWLFVFVFAPNLSFIYDEGADELVFMDFVDRVLVL